MTKIFILSSLVDKIKKWYRGKYVPPPENDLDSPIVIISPGYYEQPLVAKALKQIGKFWVNHWQWILGFIVAIAGLIAAIIKLG